MQKIHTRFCKEFLIFNEANTRCKTSFGVSDVEFCRQVIQSNT